MGHYGSWGGFGFFATVILLLVPTWRIVSRAGFHGAWSLLILVPLVNLIALWVFAFQTWPRDTRPAAPAAPGAPGQV